MYFKYGSFQHDDNSVEFSAMRTAKLDSGGVPFGQTETYKLRGEIRADTQAALTVAIDALKAAYAIPFQDLILYDNSGNETSHALKNSNTLGGVKVIEGPSFPNSLGAEYSIFRTFEVTLSADTPIAGQGQNSTVDWQESLTFVGTGGPRHVWQTLLTGTAIRQQVSELTTIKAVQRGQAVGYADYVAYPAGLYPIEVEHQEQRVYDRGTPQYLGGGVRRYYPCSWTYVFEFNNPATGNPTGRPT